MTLEGGNKNCRRNFSRCMPFLGFQSLPNPPINLPQAGEVIPLIQLEWNVDKRLNVQLRLNVKKMYCWRKVARSSKQKSGCFLCFHGQRNRKQCTLIFREEIIRKRTQSSDLYFGLKGNQARYQLLWKSK